MEYNQLIEFFREYIVYDSISKLCNDSGDRLYYSFTVCDPNDDLRSYLQLYCKSPTNNWKVNYNPAVDAFKVEYNIYRRSNTKLQKLLDSIILSNEKNERKHDDRADAVHYVTEYFNEFNIEESKKMYEIKERIIIQDIGNFDNPNYDINKATIALLQLADTQMKVKNRMQEVEDALDSMPSVLLEDFENQLESIQIAIAMIENITELPEEEAV